FLFFTDHATTELYPLSLHDALPIYGRVAVFRVVVVEHLVGPVEELAPVLLRHAEQFGDGLQRQFAGDLFDEVAAAALLGLVHDPDRKSTRLNSSHVKISYAVFCLKK